MEKKSTVGERFVEVEVDLLDRKETIRLGKLTVYDRIRVLKNLKALRRNQLKETLKEVGESKEAMTSLLFEFDSRELNDSDLFDYAKTAEGGMQSYELSLAKHNKPEDVKRIMEDHGAWLVEQFFLLMGDIWGFTLKEPEPKAESEEEAPNQVPSTADPIKPETEMYATPTPANT